MQTSTHAKRGRWEGEVLRCGGRGTWEQKRIRPSTPIPTNTFPGLMHVLDFSAAGSGP